MQFTPGSLHTATVTFANQAGVPFSYAVSFCLGATQVEVARVSFSIPGGQSLNVLFGITMPSTVGSYPVNFKVFFGGLLIGTFAMTENVVIFAPAIIPWTLVITSAAKVASGVGMWMMARLNTSIRNPRTIQATEKVIVRNREKVWGVWGNWNTRYTYEYTLAPGATITPSFPLTAYPLYHGDYNYFLISYQATNEFYLADVYGNTSNVVSIVN